MAQLTEDVQRVLLRIEAYEASESVANTGTGARREGEGFEKLIRELWSAVEAQVAAQGAKRDYVAGISNRKWARFTVGDRSMAIPTDLGTPYPNSMRWLEVTFGVQDLIAAFPSEAAIIAKCAPKAGPYAGALYPTIYQNLTTRFDDTVVLEEAGVLKEKILLEYKTAKSSKSRQIDGNAHERLSFQILQYLEVATRYTKCSLHVMANGAFVRYRNKYHANFHVQAERLKNFAWFSMGYSCTATEHERFLAGLLDWLQDGKHRQA